MSLVHVHQHTHDPRKARRIARHISKILVNAKEQGFAPSTSRVRIRRLPNARPTRTSSLARRIHPRRAFRGHPWFAISWDILDPSRKPLLTRELCAQFNVVYQENAPSDKILPVRPLPPTKRQRRAYALARLLTQQVQQ